MIAARQRSKMMMSTVVCMVVIAVATFTSVTPSLAVTKVDIPGWWWEEPGMREWLNYAKEICEKENPDIEINGYMVPFEDMIDKMNMAIAAGTPPDLFVAFGAENFPVLVAQNAIEPIDGYPGCAEILDRMLPLQREIAFKKGHNYGLMQTCSMRGMLLYNKKLFKEAGLSKPPTTVDEFIEYGKKIAKPPARWGLANSCPTGSCPMRYFYIMDWVLGEGGAFWDKQGCPTCNDPKVVKGVTDYKRICDSGIKPMAMEELPAKSLFDQGKAGMLIDGPWRFLTIKPEVAPYIASALMPTKTRFTGGTGGGVWVIPREAKHKEGAWKFLQVLFRYDVHKRILEFTTTFPAMKGILTDDYIKENPWGEAYKYAMEHGLVVLYPPEGMREKTLEFEKLVIDYVERIIFMNKPVEETLDEMQNAAEKWLGF